jgi:triphosphatase
VEWQFDAIDLRPVERWLARIAGPLAADANGSSTAPAPAVTAWAKPTKRLLDTYLDTDDWRVGRSGFVLRVRRSGTLGEATMKETAPSENGLRKRVEITEVLPPGGSDSLSSDGPVGRRVRALVGPLPLRHVLEVRTTRRPFDLRSGNEQVAEVALDETVISAGDGQRPTRLRRVEVEIAPARADVLVSLVDDMRRSCGLQPATLSKFEAGLLAAGVEIPGPPDVGPTEVGPSSTVGDLSYAVVRRNMTAMLVHEPGTRLGENPEELHDMRVATRRMRAAISLFEDVLPVRFRSLRDELGWIARELGAVRDLDVTLERLSEWADEIASGDRSDLPGVVSLLESQRDEARAQLLSALDSARYERLVSGLVAMLRQGPPRRAVSTRAPAAAVVPEMVTSRHRSAVKAARRARREGRPEDFHRLRIRCKRLRYALEFVSAVYEGKTSQVVRRVTRLQDSLGLLQDAHVAMERFRALATGPGAALPPATVFVMGAIAERYREDAERAYKRVPTQLKALKGSHWQKLKVVMEGRRLELAAQYRWPLQPRALDLVGTSVPQDPGLVPPL